MHFIHFEGTSQDRRHAPGAAGHFVLGDEPLTVLNPGDVLWVATRTEGDRAVPALCARLTVHHVREQETGSKADRPSQDSGGTHRVQMDAERSERCAPFACPMLLSWDVWRRPFHGVRPLSDEQARALEAAWERLPREGR